MRKGILVLGMHRSGTSALTGMLVRAGATAPKTLMEANFANERGYFESLPFMVLHNEILASADTNWRDWRPFPQNWRASTAAADYRARAVALLAEEFGQAPLFALKDPRMCRFFPFWLDVLADAGVAPLVVIPFRRPGEVALSHAARDDISFVEGQLMWLRHVLDAERDTRGLPRSFIGMSDLLNDWRGALARIGRALELAWPSLDDAAAKEIEAFLSADIKHQNEDSDAQIAGWAVRAHEALHLLVSNPVSRLAQDILDAVAVEFEQACSLFAPLIGGFEAPRSLLESTAGSGSHPEVSSTVSVAPSDRDNLLQASRILRGQLEILRAQLTT